METNLIKVNFMISTVAPHTRCVDWNFKNSLTFSRSSSVAPHTRCVDWNPSKILHILYPILSHLTRGAWIEIPKSVIVLGLVQVAPHTRCVDWNCICGDNSPCVFMVAPHTRCVDWNIKLIIIYMTVYLSHLTRGAWIEILKAFSLEHWK